MTVFIIMGPSGSGKTTVGNAVGHRCNLEFADADDFHSDANRQKMKSGEALTDADRMPWLQSLHEKIMDWVAEGSDALLACSALKQLHRSVLLHGTGTGIGRDNEGQIIFVHLAASRAKLIERVGSRRGHFFGTNLLDSQLNSLQAPQEESEPATKIDADAPLDDVVEQIVHLVYSTANGRRRS